jgi:hypothetical protein
VLPLQSFEHGEAILNLLQPLGRRIDAIRVGAQEEGKILELPLDTVRASTYGANCGSMVASSPTRFHTPPRPDRIAASLS